MVSRRSTSSLRALVFTACAAFCLPAAAEPSDADRALAQELFDEARQLMAAEQYAPACAKLAQSQRLAPGGGTLLNLALCHESLGRTATAWSEYNLALSQAIKDGRQDRQDIAHERIDALAQSLAHVSIDVDARAPNDMTVTIDDEPLARDAWRTEVPADPGDHRIEAKAAGRKPWRESIHVAASKTQHVTVPLLLETDAPASAPPPDAGPTREPPPPQSNVRRTASFILMGVGVASIGLGAGFGVATLSNRDEANRYCPGTAPCASSAGLDASDRAHAFAWGADIGVGVGIAALAVGAYLFFTTPAGRAPARPAALQGAPPAIFF